MKMNKIIGILLAVCFLLSVTVAAVSAGASPAAGYGDKTNGYKENNNDKWGGGGHGGHDDKWDGHGKKKWVWKCHTEYKKKLVKIIYKHHGKPIKIYKWKAVKVCYKVPVHHGHGHGHGYNGYEGR
ncbi:hypothetical protein BGV40_02485 [Methanosarcina sp. Ant1]|nr:hypothetical protein BGV40_02485 [Methanosarcina sp. Ant1]